MVAWRTTGGWCTGCLETPEEADHQIDCPTSMGFQTGGRFSGRKGRDRPHPEGSRWEQSSTAATFIRRRQRRRHSAPAAQTVSNRGTISRVVRDRCPAPMWSSRCQAVGMVLAGRGSMTTCRQVMTGKRLTPVRRGSRWRWSGASRPGASAPGRWSKDGFDLHRFKGLGCNLPQRTLMGKPPTGESTAGAVHRIGQTLVAIVAQR